MLLKTKDGLLKTEDVLLKIKDNLLKTEDNRKHDVNICLQQTQEQKSDWYSTSVLINAVLQCPPFT